MMKRRTASKSSTTKEEDPNEEFRDLTKLVQQLKKESLKHLDLEVQAQTEFEAINAQMRSTRSTMGKLAEVMNEDIEEIKDSWSQQLQEYQIETNQRLADLQNAIERLEFRFVHHVRDCQVMGDQIDRHQDGIAAIKLQLSQSQVDQEKYHDQQICVVQDVKMASLKAQEQAKYAVEDCSQRIESFQERLIHFSKGLEEELQESIENTRNTLRDIEAGHKRQSITLHKTIDDVIEIRNKVSSVEQLRSIFERHQTRFGELLNESNKQIFSNENKWTEIESALNGLRTGTAHSIRAHEIRVKSKLDALTQTLVMLTQIL